MVLFLALIAEEGTEDGFRPVAASLMPHVPGLPGNSDGLVVHGLSGDGLLSKEGGGDPQGTGEEGGTNHSNTSN